MKPEIQINNYMRYFFKNCFLIYIILKFHCLLHATKLCIC